jgi:GT2 family glycosyltransferase
MTDATPTVSMIVVADGPWDDTFRCLRALQEGAAGVSRELIVVDDGTRDETGLALPRLEGLTALRSNAPRGFSTAANAGAAIARGRYLAFLHADAEPHPDWLAPLLAVVEADPGVAVAASRLLTRDGMVEADGVVFAYAAPYPLTPVAHGAGAPALPAADVLEASAASGAAMLVRADAFRAAQGFDEAHGTAAGALDLCLRLRAAGGRLVVARASVAVHHARCSGEISDADAAWLTRRWLGKVPLFDPAAYRERTPAPRRPGRPPLSVVVPMRNALGTIAPCLEALARNLGPDDELIIADAGSEDGTREFASLFAAERGGSTRFVDGGAPGGLEGALRAGLGAASRPLAVLFHPVAQAPDGFLDALTQLLDRPGAPAAVATPMPPAGTCVSGPASLLRALGADAPTAFFAADAAALSQALRARGEALGLVEQ